MDAGEVPEASPEAEQSGGGSADELIELVYDDLLRMARARMGREASGSTLQPTALVHEVYLRMADQREQTWVDRTHFVALAATAMRRVLANAARDRGAQKRGGAWGRVTFDSAMLASGGEALDVLDFEAALERLGRIKERYARIVELRCFAGLGVEETAEVLGVSRTIVVREWAIAKGWLSSFLEEGEQNGERET